MLVDTFTSCMQILVGNKSDMADEKRAVPYAKGQALADEYKIRFFETSAKDNVNVEEVCGRVCVCVCCVDVGVSGWWWGDTAFAKQLQQGRPTCRTWWPAALLWSNVRSKAAVPMLRPLGCHLQHQLCCSAHSCLLDVLLCHAVVCLTCSIAAPMHVLISTDVSKPLPWLAANCC